MIVEDYMAQMGYAFFAPRKPRNFLPTMGTDQKQALGINWFRKNQELFRIFTAMDRALRKQIVAAVQPVFLSPLVDQLTGFG